MSSKPPIIDTKQDATLSKSNNKVVSIVSESITGTKKTIEQPTTGLTAVVNNKSSTKQPIKTIKQNSVKNSGSNNFLNKSQEFAPFKKVDGEENPGFSEVFLSSQSNTILPYTQKPLINELSPDGFF